MGQTTVLNEEPSPDQHSTPNEAEGILAADRRSESLLSFNGGLVGNEAAAHMAAKKLEFMEFKGALAIVNSINALTFETRMNEKAYMLHEEAKDFDAISEHIATLFRCYGELERLRPDAGEQKQIADARKATQEYREAVETWVDTRKVTASDEQTMNDKGELVGNEASGYLASKKAEYLDARKALVIVNSINKLISDVRMNERSYMLEKEQGYFEFIEEHTLRLLTLYDDLETLHPDSTEEKQILEARRATSEYLAAARAWAAEQKKENASDKLAELARKLEESGTAVSKCAAEYLAAKQVRADKVADAVFIVADIAETAMQTRLHEKAYILSQNEENWKSLNDNINRLPKLYEDLRKVSFTREDQDRIDRAAKATEEYLAAAKSWVGTNRQMKIAASTMDNSGQVVGNAAVQYQGNKQATVDRMADAVFEVILAESAALEVKNVTLMERLKELDCLYHVTGTIATSAISSVPALLDAVVHCVPMAFLYPEHCGARLTVHEVSRHTDKFVVSPWRMEESVCVDGHIVGCIVISYSQDCFGGSDDPFLPEERRLVQALSQRLGKAVEHIHAQEALRAERTALEDKNTALREVIDWARKDKDDLASQIVTNVNKVLMPIIHSLENALPSTLRGYTGLLRRSLEEIASPLVSKISQAHEALTPAELQICDLVGQGLTAKEISQIRSISPVTVLRHRQNIRKKLGITNKQVNLASYLCKFGKKEPNATGNS